MRTCKLCETPHPNDVHFCSCGAFLDWEPVDEAPTIDPAAAPTSVVTAAEHVSVRLFLPDQPIEPDFLTTSVAPGGTTLVIARVRNQSDIVDSYSLRLEGLPEGWYTVDTPTVYLLAYDAREAYEEDVPIAIHPPRTPHAVADRWPIAVVATSQAHPTRVARAHAGVDIEPFWQIGAAPRPAVVTGLRRGELDGEVHNTGNAPVPVVLAAADAEDRCRFALPAEPVRIAAGTSAALPVVVRPKRPHIIGRKIDHRLELVARTADDQELAAPFTAVYRQRPWIAWWIPIVLLLLLIAAVILYLLWPDTAEVPDVVEQPSAFAAQKKLEEEGLTLNPKVEAKPRKGAKPGSVIDQAPDAGERVDEGKAVTVVVAAGRDKVRVPKLKGLKVADADQKLQRAGLTLGAVEPELNPDAKVGSQVPKAKVRRRRGSPVNVVLAPPKKAGGKKKKDAGAAEEVPAVAGGSAAAAVAALKKAGLVPMIERRIDEAPAGEVIGTVPPKGDPPPPDGVVTLIVSLGFPRLAFDTGTTALIAGGITGRPLRPIADAGAAVASTGAWSGDGSRVTFTRKGRLFVRRPGSNKRSSEIAPGRIARAAHPAFAPLSRSRIIAFAKDGGSPSKSDTLCWTDVTRTTRKTPSCRKLTGWSIDGVSWGPKAKLLLVSVTATSGPRRGILRLVSTSESLSDAGEWRVPGRLATPTDGSRGVIAAAFHPGGKQIAVVANLETGDFRVALVAADDLRLAKPEYLRLSGCDVAWRPDGKELAVVQSGSLCPQPRLGQIVRVQPGDERSVQTVVMRGQHPSWEPLR